MTARARESLEEKIAAGEHYDAQQLAKTVQRRLRAKGECAAAADFCVECAGRLSRCGQHDLAADLGRDLMECYESSRAPSSDENLDRVERLLAGIPAHAASTPKYAVLQRALRWSAGTAAQGHPRLHRLAACAYWAEREYGKCQAHLVYCGDGPALASMVREWRQRGYPNEEDLFSLRTLLILLSLNDVGTARTFWEAMAGDPCSGDSASSSSAPADFPASASSAAAAAADLPADASEPPQPPVQCGTFLLAAAEARSLNFFRMVRGKYALVLRRDSSFDKYLNEIEVRIFSAPQQRGGIGAIFDALLGGGGGGDGLGGGTASAGG